MATLLACGLLILGMAACAKPVESAGQIEVKSQSANVAVASAPGSAEPPTSTRGGDASSTTKPDASPPTIPDAPELPSVPGAGNLQQCVEVATTYTEIFKPFSSGAPTQAEIDHVATSLEALKPKVPKNIADDFQVLADGIGKASSLPALAEFTTGPDFAKANDEISKYLGSACTSAS